MPIISKRNRVALDFFLRMVKYREEHSTVSLSKFLASKTTTINQWFAHLAVPSQASIEKLYYFLTLHRHYRDMGFYYIIEEYENELSYANLKAQYKAYLENRPTKYRLRYRGEKKSPIYNPNGKDDNYFSPGILRQKLTTMIDNMDARHSGIVHITIERVTTPTKISTESKYVDTFSPYYLSEMLTKLYAALYIMGGDSKLDESLREFGSYLESWYGFSERSGDPSSSTMRWLSATILKLSRRVW